VPQVTHRQACPKSWIRSDAVVEEFIFADKRPKIWVRSNAVREELNVVSRVPVLAVRSAGHDNARGRQGNAAGTAHGYIVDTGPRHRSCRSILKCLRARCTCGERKDEKTAQHRGDCSCRPASLSL